MDQCRVCKVNARCSSTCLHGNVAPRRDYAMAISAVQSAAHHARRDGIRPSLPSSGLFTEGMAEGVLSKKNRADDTRTCVSLLSLPAILSMKRTFSDSFSPQCQLYIKDQHSCVSFQCLLVPTHAHSFYKAAETRPAEQSSMRVISGHSDPRVHHQEFSSRGVR